MAFAAAHPEQFDKFMAQQPAPAADKDKRVSFQVRFRSAVHLAVLPCVIVFLTVLFLVVHRLHRACMICRHWPRLRMEPSEATSLCKISRSSLSRSTRKARTQSTVR